MANDMAWLLPSSFGGTAGFGSITSSFSATIVAKVMKQGMMAIKSIMFMTSLAKIYLLGHARNLTRSSKVNQMIASVSTIKNGSVTSGTSSSSILVPLAVVLNTLQCLNSGRVSKQKITIDSKMTNTEMARVSTTYPATFFLPSPHPLTSLGSE